MPLPQKSTPGGWPKRQRRAPILKRQRRAPIPAQGKALGADRATARGLKARPIPYPRVASSGEWVSLRKSRSCDAHQKSTPGGWPQAPTARSYTSPGQSPGCRESHSPRAESPAYSYPRVASSGEWVSLRKSRSVPLTKNPHPANGLKRQRRVPIPAQGKALGADRATDQGLKARPIRIHGLP